MTLSSPACVVLHPSLYSIYVWRIDDVINWKHFPCYWPFVRGIHQSPVDSPHKDQWREPLMFSLICPWPNGGENNRDAGDLRRHRAHCDVSVMSELVLGNNRDKYKSMVCIIGSRREVDGISSPEHIEGIICRILQASFLNVFSSQFHCKMKLKIKYYCRWFLIGVAVNPVIW